MEEAFARLILDVVRVLEMGIFGKDRNNSMVGGITMIGVQKQEGVCKRTQHLAHEIFSKWKH